jgi:nucleoside-diphosphate-sugar epimerase
MDEDFNKIIQNKNVHFIQEDLTNPLTFVQLPKDFEYIYHLAAVIGVKNVVENPDKVLYINTISTLNILEFAKNMPSLKKMLFSSTSEVYAGTMKHFGIEVPTDEQVKLVIDDITSERTTYMISKMFGEAACYTYGKKYSIPFTIVRYHNVYGPRMGFLHVIPEMFIKIINNEVIDVPSPTHTRAFCYIDDAVEMTIKVAESGKTNSELFNIGNQEQEIRIVDLVKIIADVIGKNIKINELPDTKGSPARRCPNISKIKKYLEYSPGVGLKEGIFLTYQWYKDKLDQDYE